MKKNITFYLLFTISFLFFSCSEDSNTNNPDPINYQTNIEKVNPNPVTKSDTLTITGKNFGASRGSSIVSFAGTIAIDYINWSFNEIKVKVPKDANTGKLWLLVNNEKSNEVDLIINEIKKPIIISVNPISALVNEFVTINGENFGNSQGQNKVYISSVTAPKISVYSHWSNSLIQFRVPYGAKSGKIWVLVNDEKSNELDFEVKSTIKGDSLHAIIGNQVWMKRNLDVSKYRNGDTIRYVRNKKDWIDAAQKREGAWCYFNNDPEHNEIHGKLYNWYAVNDPRGLAPVGYHVASNEEWATLRSYLWNNSQYWCGDDSIKVSKSLASKENWLPSPVICSIGNDRDLNNSTGFSAQPSGWLLSGFEFVEFGEQGIWWSSTEINTNTAYTWYLPNGNTKVFTSQLEVIYGLSVRCIKD